MQVPTWPSGLIKPYGLYYAYFSEEGTLRSFVVSQFRLVDGPRAQRFNANSISM